jgi:Na+-translocating ferredoxin:NAD+ oxidoreductase RnfG subunit
MSLQVPSKLQKKVRKEIKKTFETTDFVLKPFFISSQDKESLPIVFSEENFFCIQIAEQVIGYAFVEKAPSKTADFDFMVVLDENLIIKKTKVLIYREEYGGEIASKRWLKQFNGKTNADSFAYKKDISAISGATISVQSMTNAVNNFMKSIGILHKNNVL